MNASLPRYGLYVLTPERSGAALVQAVGAAIAGGAAMVQYRAKQAATDADAVALARLCRAGGVPLIVNDDPALARRCGADGVHIGRDDPDCASARAACGAGAIIGVSCYDSLDRALSAQAHGADYVAFGSFFASSTKPHAVRAPLALLRRARERLSIPICAIGGITAANARTLIEAGADLLAVLDGVFGCGDQQAAARRLARLFPARGEPISEGDTR